MRDAAVFTRAGIHQCTCKKISRIALSRSIRSMQERTLVRKRLSAGWLVGGATQNKRCPTLVCKTYTRTCAAISHRNNPTVYISAVSNKHQRRHLIPYYHWRKINKSLAASHYSNSSVHHVNIDWHIRGWNKFSNLIGRKEDRCSLKIPCVAMPVVQRCNGFRRELRGSAPPDSKIGARFFFFFISLSKKLANKLLARGGKEDQRKKKNRYREYLK